MWHNCGMRLRVWHNCGCNNDLCMYSSNIVLTKNKIIIAKFSRSNSQYCQLKLYWLLKREKIAINIIISAEND